MEIELKVKDGMAAYKIVEYARKNGLKVDMTMDSAFALRDAENEHYRPRREANKHIVSESDFCLKPQIEVGIDPDTPIDITYGFVFKCNKHGCELEHMHSNENDDEFLGESVTTIGLSCPECVKEGIGCGRSLRRTHLVKFIPRELGH